MFNKLIKFQVFDSSISTLNVEINKLETEVTDMEKVIENEETKWKNLKNDIEVKEEILNDINEDTADIGNDKKKSQKYILSEKIAEQESVKKTLELEMQQTMAEKVCIIMKGWWGAKGVGVIKEFHVNLAFVC